ncbi:MAG: hypothetical protein ACI81R_002555 [Bradymonadia bacterium]|jgi:hypothetical protein
MQLSPFLALTILCASTFALATSAAASEPGALGEELAPNSRADCAADPECELAPRLLDITGTEAAPQWLYARSVFGISARPIGLLLDNQLEHRWRLWRTDAIPFQNTFLGVGARVALSPAYLDVGPQVTFAPADLFDLQMRATYSRYYAGANGLVGYATIGDTTSDTREAFAQGTLGDDMLSLSIAPTLKLKVGPIIAVGSATITAIYTDEDEALPLAFDVYRNLTIARGSELVTEYNGALIAELLDGDRGPLLWLGALAEHARTRESRDQRTAVGPLVVVRPSRSMRGPRFLIQGRYYTEDSDFQPGFGAKFAVIWDGNLIRPRDARLND